jgi:thioredoxin 1
VTSFPIINGSQLADATSEGELVLLDFWQASCAPCRTLEPRLERFADAHPDRFTGYRIDVDTDTDTVARYGVMSIPTVLLLRDGHEIARLDGLIRDQDLEDAVRAAAT